MNETKDKNQFNCVNLLSVYKEMNKLQLELLLQKEILEIIVISIYGTFSYMTPKGQNRFRR